MAGMPSKLSHCDPGCTPTRQCSSIWRTALTSGLKLPCKQTHVLTTSKSTIRRTVDVQLIRIDELDRVSNPPRCAGCSSAPIHALRALLQPLRSSRQPAACYGTEQATHRLVAMWIPPCGPGPLHAHLLRWQRSSGLQGGCGDLVIALITLIHQPLTETSIRPSTPSITGRWDCGRPPPFPSYHLED